ncbi:NACHT domain-containing protein [Gigaspora margarita]|uniref:NACHT domain-containing protein n=1 Tax=Gigaspora margarita TaxID=4874 RepID=A0A8H4EPG1_GIGMA|nr:NACHT domain-containing protein [Gigaspora margarita]
MTRAPAKILEQAILCEKDIKWIDYNKFTKPQSIAKGGFGYVFKCELKDLNVEVIHKCPKFDNTLNEKTIKKLIGDFIKEHSRNILIHQGNPKIADLGASKQVNEASMTSDSEVFGVLEYTDPHCIEYGEDKRRNREEPIESTPSQYLELYKKCWDHDPDNRPETNLIPNTLENIIRDEAQIEEGMKNLEGAQSSDLESNREGEVLAQIGMIETQNETHEFKEALKLYVKPRGTWNVPIIKTSNDKEEMDDEKKEEGDVEEVVERFLTSKDKLTSHDKEILENAANEFLIDQDKTLLIKKINGFFEPENQLTLEDRSVMNIAADQFFVLKGKKALMLLKMAAIEFLESPKEGTLKDITSNLLESSYKRQNYGPSFKRNLDLVHQITIEDERALKKASNDKDLVTTANELLTLKAKEVLETALNKLLTLKRKKVLLILGSGGTGKSTFNRYLARRLWECAKNDLTQSAPLFIALAPLEGLINKNQDFIEAYLGERGKLSPDQIKELRNRKFVFILDGYDEIAERDRHCYDSNMFTEWKNAKIIISCRPEYLDEDSGKRFWPKENGKKGFQELTLTPFSWAEIEQYIKNYVDYSKKNNNKLLWNADRYIQEIKTISQIEELVCNPVLLKITLTILPDLRKRGMSQINRIVLYDEFIKKWFERAQDRLQKIQLKKEEKEEFVRLKEGFTNHCLQFGKQFASEMFVNSKVVVNYDPINEITSEWAKFLGNTVVKIRLIRFSMPLFRRGNQYWFFHKSLRDYLISCALIDSFKNTSQITLLNKQSIIPEPAIQQFLVEQIQQMPEYIQPLLNFIEHSKMNPNIQIASANAITVLSRASTQLPVNLNNIRVPGADLNNGIFNYLQLVRADLDHVNFQNAKLQSANLEGAFLQATNLQNAKLQDVNLTGANLSGANLRHSNLQGANLQNARLQNANLEGASLQDVNLTGAYLTGANLQDANLQNAKLQNANLEGASLQDVNLTGACLTDTNLRRSNLQGANFQDSYLKNVKFEGASLRVPDFRRFVPNTDLGDIYF